MKLIFDDGIRHSNVLGATRDKVAIVLRARNQTNRGSRRISIRRDRFPKNVNRVRHLFISQLQMYKKLSKFCEIS